MESMLGMALGMPNLNAMLQFRLPDGRLRIDMGSLSIITIPALGLRFLLNHLSFEARMLGFPGMPGMVELGALPGGPAMELALLAASLIAGGPQSIIKLGRAIIQGLEAEGMRYLLNGSSVAMMEVWTSVKFGLPIMTTMFGAFGQSMQICNIAGIVPPLSMFEIPPGYRILNPPSVPIPGAPQIPVVPNVMPQGPAIPGVGMPPMPAAGISPGIVMPGVPTTPGIPGIPSIPNVAPGMPQVPMQPLPNIPGFPQAPAPPQLPMNVPSVPGLSNFPIPGAQGLPGGLSAPPLPNMIPNLPNPPQPPRAPVFPNLAPP